MKHKRDSWQTWENYARAALASGHYQAALRGLQRVRKGERCGRGHMAATRCVAEGRQVTLVRISVGWKGTLRRFRDEGNARRRWGWHATPCNVELGSTGSARLCGTVVHYPLPPPCTYVALSFPQSLELSSGQRLYQDVVSGLLDVLEGRPPPPDGGMNPEAKAAADAEDAEAREGAGEGETQQRQEEEEDDLKVCGRLESVGDRGQLGKCLRGLDELCSVAPVVVRAVATPAVYPSSQDVADFSGQAPHSRLALLQALWPAVPLLLPPLTPLPLHPPSPWQLDEAALGVPLLPLLADMPLPDTHTDGEGTDEQEGPPSGQGEQGQPGHGEQGPAQGGAAGGEGCVLLSGREREFLLSGMGALLRQAVNAPCCAPPLWGSLARYWALRGEPESAKEARLKQVGMHRSSR